MRNGSIAAVAYLFWHRIAVNQIATLRNKTWETACHWWIQSKSFFNDTIEIFHVNTLRCDDITISGALGADLLIQFLESFRILREKVDASTKCRCGGLASSNCDTTKDISMVSFDTYWQLTRHSQH